MVSHAPVIDSCFDTTTEAYWRMLLAGKAIIFLMTTLAPGSHQFVPIFSPYACALKTRRLCRVKLDLWRNQHKLRTLYWNETNYVFCHQSQHEQFQMVGSCLNKYLTVPPPMWLYFTASVFGSELFKMICFIKKHGTKISCDAIRVAHVWGSFRLQQVSSGEEFFSGLWPWRLIGGHGLSSGLGGFGMKTRLEGDGWGSRIMKEIRLKSNQ